MFLPLPQQANLTLEADEARTAMSRAESLEMPVWSTADAGHFNALQITSALLHLSTRQPEIETLFFKYCAGEARMELRQWLDFVRMEQVRQPSIMPQASRFALVGW